MLDHGISQSIGRLCFGGCHMDLIDGTACSIEPIGSTS